MKITVHDTLSLLEPLYCEPSRPQDRLELARPVLYAEDSFFQKFKLVSRAQRTRLFQIMQAGAIDGYSVVNAQQGWGLFNPSRTLEASSWTFDRFRKESVLTRLHDSLETAARHLPSPLPENLNVFLLPADPANRALMLRSHGLSVFGAVPSIILVQLWPSAGNLARLGPLLTRALVHTTTWQEGNLDTLENVIKLEERASELIEQHYPTLADPRLLAVTAPNDWQAALPHAAELCGAENYDAVRANIYGADGSSIAPLPAPVQIDAEETAYAQVVLKEGLAETQASRIAAYLYGDEIVAPQGHVGVGMPLFGGLTVAY